MNGGNPIRVIRQLDCRLAARTQGPLVNRMRRLTLELLGGLDGDDAGLTVAHRLEVGIHDAHGKTAAGTA